MRTGLAARANRSTPRGSRNHNSVATVLKRILFVCEGNQSRSPTAEAIFRDAPGLEVRSAGFNPFARTQVEETMMEWADLVVAMDRRVERHLRLRFEQLLAQRTVVCLDIPDEYDYMQPDLIAELGAFRTSPPNFRPFFPQHVVAARNP